jgi:hypothetical protein
LAASGENAECSHEIVPAEENTQEKGMGSNQSEEAE